MRDGVDDDVRQVVVDEGVDDLAAPALADAGEVDVLRSGSGEAVYRRCATDDHHHHLVCRRCGKAVEIAGPAVETWAQRVADEHGYTDLSHTVEIFGLCRECGPARPAG